MSSSVGRSRIWTTGRAWRLWIATLSVLAIMFQGASAWAQQAVAWVRTGVLPTPEGVLTDGVTVATEDSTSLADLDINGDGQIDRVMSVEYHFTEGSEDEETGRTVGNLVAAVRSPGGWSGIILGQETLLGIDGAETVGSFGVLRLGGEAVVWYQMLEGGGFDGSGGISPGSARTEFLLIHGLSAASVGSIPTTFDGSDVLGDGSSVVLTRETGRRQRFAVARWDASHRRIAVSRWTARRPSSR